MLRSSVLDLDRAGRGGPNPSPDGRARQAANLAIEADAAIKHVLNGLGDRVATVVNPMAFGFDPSIKPYKQDIPRAKRLLADAGFPNGIDIRFRTGLEVVEPAVLQTDETLSADMAKAGIRAQLNYIW